MSTHLITPKDLQQRVLKIWLRGDLHRAFLQKKSCFPLTITLKSISAKNLLTDYTSLQSSIHRLRQEAEKHHYIITDKTIVHRQLGQQRIPTLICFNTETILLNYLKKNAEFQHFKTFVEQTLQQEPSCFDFLLHAPHKMMRYAMVWPQLLTVCRYFKQHPQPNCYLRQLEIDTVDTKFIEQHKAILNELLPCVLHTENYDETITGLSHHGFERRYGLRYDPPLIRLRILDPRLAIQGLTDLSLTQTEFNHLSLNVKTVFVVENKITGLAFPDYPHAIVIFALGYAVNLLQAVRCLQHSTLYYWGDLDTHGFAILARLRHYYPQANSILMDQDTLNTFQHLSVLEPEKTAEKKLLEHLTVDENSLYKQLQQSLQRLEQERISFKYLQQVLIKL